MAFRILPTFNGYTIDNRLREFRKVLWTKLPEFIEFDSPEGRKLISEFFTFVSEFYEITKRLD